MRGEHLPRIYHQYSAIRFIPACAGNTYTVRRKIIKLIGSSPHARGTPVHNPYRIPSQPVHPRMRGEHSSIFIEFFSQKRFIPACAGNTATPASPHLTIPVHPRMRGEHVLRRPRKQGRIRFIPACAGNTSILTLYFSDNIGSSPHARGTHCQ